MINNNEAALLAMMINRPNIYYRTALSEKYFTSAITRKVYLAIKRAVSELEIEPNPINLIDIDPEITGKHIAEITEFFTGEFNHSYHESIIISEYQRQEVKIMLAEQSAHITTSAPSKVIEDIENKITDIYRTTGSSDIIKLSDAGTDFIDALEERKKNGGGIVGVPSGWAEVDNYLLGFQPELFYILGARPSQGKTAAGLNIAAHLALHKAIPIGFLSLESGVKELIGRVAASESSIGLHKLKRADLKAYEYQYLGEAMSRIKAAPFYVVDKPNMTLSEVCAQARRLVATKKIQMLFIDYLSIVDAEMPKATKRDQVSKVSLTLKQLARQLSIPVLALAQLTRDAHDKRPNLSNLAETGQIERDADGVIFIWHDNSKDEGQSYFLIDKNRDGATGAIRVVFNRSKMTFREEYRD